MRAVENAMHGSIRNLKRVIGSGHVRILPLGGVLGRLH